MIPGQALLLRYPRLNGLYLALDQLFKHFGGHPCPPLLQDQLEDGVVEQAFWLAPHRVEHALVLVLLDQLGQPAGLNQKLEGLGDLVEHVAKDLVVGVAAVVFGGSELRVGDNVEELGQEGSERVDEHVGVHRLLLGHHGGQAISCSLIMLDWQVKVWLLGHAGRGHCWLL